MVEGSSGVGEVPELVVTGVVIGEGEVYSGIGRGEQWCGRGVY